MNENVVRDHSPRHRVRHAAATSQSQIGSSATVLFDLVFISTRRLASRHAALTGSSMRCAMAARQD
jgi:hypothetical protein